MLKLGIVAGFCAALAMPAYAQDSSATVEINPLSVEGLVIGNRYVMDAAFAAQHNVNVPAPFSFIAPTSESYQIYVQPAPGGVGIFKLSFVTLDQQVKSNLQFVPFTVTRESEQAQLDGLKAILEQAFRGSIPDIERSQLDTVQITHIGEYRAVEAIGRYDGGANGTVVLRVVAIPHPETNDGVVAIINVLLKNEAMTELGDVLNVDASRALGTFRFE